MSLLQVVDVDVRFGGVHAVQEVRLEAEAARVTGLIGPNGAGKTTLFNVITGLQEPTAGRVKFDGRDITDVRPHKRARLGMARTFQRLEVFGSLTARENVLVAAEIRKSWSSDGSNPRAVTEEILDRVGIREVADDRVDSMPTGMARLVELGRALATNPRLVLLDEPGSGLDQQESDALGRLLIDLADDGLAVLLVEHDVELVMHVCHLVYVLDFGRIIALGTPAQVQADPRVQAAYLGSEEGLEDIEAAALADEGVDNR
ncbi:MAG: ABC transporter ATP-binding protein [Actinobacteria bacterium]|nr:MAG: ABC transporter ATP-binding protein [Actinomycetota bacterium]